MASLCRATSSCDHRSKALFIESRSCSRNSGLMSCSKLIGSSLVDKSLLPSVSLPNHRPTHQRPGARCLSEGEIVAREAGVESLDTYEVLYQTASQPDVRSQL